MLDQREQVLDQPAQSVGAPVDRVHVPGLGGVQGAGHAVLQQLGVAADAGRGRAESWLTVATR